MYKQSAFALRAAVLGGFLCVAGTLHAWQETPKPTPENSPTHDRTHPDKARNGAADRELMQKIRKAVIDDKSLSTYAHNVKISAKNGKVTLKGPVRSEEERKSIETKATEAAGAGNVTNQLTVKPAK